MLDHGSVGVAAIEAAALLAPRLMTHAAIGCGNLVVSRLYERHVNALHLLCGFGTRAQQATARLAAPAVEPWFGVWNSESADGFRQPLGMHASASYCVDFGGITVRAAALSRQAGDYTRKHAFSAGADPYAAVQLGGAEGIHDETRRLLRDVDAATTRTSAFARVRWASPYRTRYWRHLGHVCWPAICLRTSCGAVE